MLTDEQFIEYLYKTLKKGSLITLKGDVPFPSPKSHHFVVLNSDPQSDEFLVTVNHTSRVVSRLDSLQRLGHTDIDSTTVVFPGNRYPFFPQQTLFDCNMVHALSSADLLAAYKRNNLSVPDNEISLTDEDLEKIINAALSSRSVSPIHKKMISAKS